MVARKRSRFFWAPSHKVGEATVQCEFLVRHASSGAQGELQGTTVERSEQLLAEAMCRVLFLATRVSCVLMPQLLTFDFRLGHRLRGS